MNIDIKHLQIAITQPVSLPFEMVSVFFTLTMC